MTERERWVNALTFKPVDRIPLVPGGPRESTLARWHSEGLPADMPCMDYIYGVLGIEPQKTGPRTNLPLRFTMIPEYEPETLAHRDGHYVVRDEKGIVCEISDRYDASYLRVAKDFVTRRYLEFPVKNRDDWERMKLRYDPDDPARLPAGLESFSRAAEGRDHYAEITVHGPFWQLREWLGFETLCMWFLDEPELIEEMCTFWKDYILALMRKFLPYYRPDAFRINEDMAYKAHPMISPAMTREFLQPVYKTWTAELRKWGVPIADIDSDGCVDLLIPIWIESGINVCEPMEAAAMNDIVRDRAIYGKSIAYRGGIDKRAIAAGGKTMRDEVLRVVSPFLREGGIVPSCDHGVPPDIPLRNFIEYTRLLAELTGWL